MELFIGGCFQGKLRLVSDSFKNNLIIDENNIDLFLNIINEKEPGLYLEANQTLIINHLHLIIRAIMEEGLCYEAIMKSINVINTNNENLVIICDEIGSGVVPIDAFEREYRELVGRTLIEIAKNADNVWRVICQQKVKIK